MKCILRLGPPLHSVRCSLTMLIRCGESVWLRSHGKARRVLALVLKRRSLSGLLADPRGCRETEVGKQLSWACCEARIQVFAVLGQWSAALGLSCQSSWSSQNRNFHNSVSAAPLAHQVLEPTSDVRKMAISSVFCRFIRRACQCNPERTHLFL